MTGKVKAAAQGEYIHILRVPFEERAFAAKYGGTWSADIRQHIYRGVTLPPQLADYAAQPYSLEAWLQAEINGDTTAPQSAVNQYTPREHQVAAIKKIRGAAVKGWRGFVNADETGLGKSLASLIGMNEVAKVRGFTPERPAKLLILAPKSVLPHWRETVLAARRYTTHLRVMILNYDQSLKLLDAPAAAQEAKKRTTANRRTATGGTPAIEWDLIIADEAHRLKNKSQRSAAFDVIARAPRPAAEAPFVIYASATIGQNPLELRYLASLYGQLMKQRGLSSKTWGNYLAVQGYQVREGKVDWVWLSTRSNMTPAEKQRVLQLQQQDVNRMANVLFAPGAPAIRRSPADIAGWPEIQRQEFPIEFDPRERQLYLEAWREFRRELAMEPRGKNPKSQLTIRLRFQQKASLLLVPHTVDYVQDLVEQGYQVAISTQFIETVAALQTAFDARKITSARFTGQPGLDREEERLLFQLGRASVIMFTVTEGISLHAGQQLPYGRTATSAPRMTVVHDPYYTGIQSTQVEGRAHRDGQNSNVYYMYAEGTVQKPILDIMMNRLRNMRRLSGDRDVEALQAEDLDALTEIEQLLAAYDEEPGTGQ